MRTLLPIVAVALAASAFAAGGGAASEPALRARDASAGEAAPALDLVNTGATALEIARAIALDPANVYGAEFIEIPPSGKPTAVSDTALAGFPVAGATFGILTTGNAAFAPTPNTSPGTSAVNNGPNVRGNTDYDVVVLKVQLKSLPVHTDACVTVEYRFLTEEYPEFIGSEYNDAFVAESGVSTWDTEDSVVTAPNNFAWRDAGDIVSLNQISTSQLTAAAAAGTTYDGATPHYRAATAVTPTLVGLDVVYEVFFSIFDQGDRYYDSAVFLDNVDLFYGLCTPGAVKVAD